MKLYIEIYSEYTTHCSKFMPLNCSEPWCRLRCIWKAFFDGDMVLQSGHWYLRFLLRWTSLTCRDKLVLINLLQGLQIWPPSVYTVQHIVLDEGFDTTIWKKRNKTKHQGIAFENVNYKLVAIENTLIEVKASKLLGRMMSPEMNLQSIFWWSHFVAQWTLILQVGTEVHVSHMAV